MKNEEIVSADKKFSLVTAQMEHVKDNRQIPPSLKARTFPPDRGYGGAPTVYDHSADKNLCGSSPTDDNLYCRQSAALDWIGYRWYKFTEQPGLQRLNLDPAKKEILQRRIERLHKALNKNLHLNPWLKPPTEGIPDLVNLDPAHLINEIPHGMEVGYVPIAVYQGMSKPSNCVEDSLG